MRGGHWMAATLIGALASAPALAQETRPAINVAVQTIVTSGALDVLREQSNVGARVVYTNRPNLGLSAVSNGGIL